MNKTNRAISKFLEFYKEQEATCLPWQMSWVKTRPNNPVTGTKYSGMNRLILSFYAAATGKNAQFVTYKQTEGLRTLASFQDACQSLSPSRGCTVENLRIHVKKGAKGFPVCYYSPRDSKDSDSKDSDSKDSDSVDSDSVDTGIGRSLITKSYTVFSLTDIVVSSVDPVTGDTEWTEDYLSFTPDSNMISTTSTDSTLPVEELGNFLKTYQTVSGIVLAQGEPSYCRQTHTIEMPSPEAFTSLLDYYTVFAHELSHSTMTPLDRKLKYAEEELVAEICASGILGFFNLPYKLNNVAYIKSWKERLEDNPEVLEKAASKAIQALDYMVELLIINN